MRALIVALGLLLTTMNANAQDDLLDDLRAESSLGKLIELTEQMSNRGAIEARIEEVKIEEDPHAYSATASLYLVFAYIWLSAAVAGLEATGEIEAVIIYQNHLDQISQLLIVDSVRKDAEMFARQCVNSDFRNCPDGI